MRCVGHSLLGAGRAGWETRGALEKRREPGNRHGQVDPLGARTVACGSSSTLPISPVSITRPAGTRHHVDDGGDEVAAPEEMCGDEGEPAHHPSNPGFPEMP